MKLNFHLICGQVPPPDEFTTKEKNEAIEVLSILLLRLRDRKTRGFKKRGLFPKLYREIEIAAQEYVGRYSDSDDESDEEDDGEGKVDGLQARFAAPEASNANAKSTAFKLESSPDSDDEPEEPAMPARRRSTKKRTSKKSRPSQPNPAPQRRSVALGPTKMDVFAR